MPLFQVQFRTDSKAQWMAENPVLLRGEMGLEEGPDGPDGAVGPGGAVGAVGSSLFKLGDGVTPWADLPYVSGPAGAVGVQGPQGEVGPAGADGAQGAPGAQGIEGVAGAQGETGSAGPAGPQGESGPQGIQGPAVPLSNSVISESETDAASSKAVKQAFDKGASAAADASAAVGKADAAQSAADAAQAKADAAESAATAAQATADVAKAVTDTVSTAPTPNAIPRAGADGKLNAGWIGGGGGMIPAGHIAMLPFRFNQLPPGWYFANGTRYNTTTTAVGAALKALPATLKSDWGMSLSGSGASETIAVPNWFYGGRGPVMRGVDGSSRQVGSVEDGAIQNITGSLLGTIQYSEDGSARPSGAFYRSAYHQGTNIGWQNNSFRLVDMSIDAARVVATANEVKMLNRGMTPAIFLGV